jgi:MATE family multidrug resistance protein
MTDIAETARPARRAWRAEASSTLQLAWPLVLTNLAQVAMGTTDVVMMGWLGPEALAAGALATNLHFAFLIFGIGIASATAPMIAVELGRKRHSVRDVRRTVRQGLWSVVIIAVPIWSIVWFAEPILIALGQDPALARVAGDYLHTFQWSLLPFLAYIVLRSFVSALERPLAAVGAGVVGILVNAFLVWCLMFGKLGFPALGLAGAGIGTTIATTVVFLSLAAVVSIDRKFRRYHLFGRWWRADWARLRALWALGVPIAATLLFEVGVFNVAALLVGRFGADMLAAHQIALQIASVSFMVPMGLGQAATVRVGLAFGAGDKDGVRRAGWTAFALGIGFMSCMAVFMLTAPHVLVGAFLDLRDPENVTVIGYAVTFLAFAGLFQVVDGGQAVAAGMLRGLQDTRVPMILAAIGYWGVAFPVGFLLAFTFGWRGNGVWTGLALGLAVVAALMTTRWIRRERLGLLDPRRAAAAP